jgi:5-methylthioadenosine/S-adenosylhomocysteine deaminase
MAGTQKEGGRITAGAQEGCARDLSGQTEPPPIACIRAFRHNATAAGDPGMLMARKGQNGKNVSRAPSRRDVFRTGAGLAALAAALPAGGAARAAAPDPVIAGNADPDRRLLIKGATIVSMDASVGDFARGDLLIQGKKIAAIAPDLGADAVTIDGRDAILIPGLVDAHRHSWEGQLRRINPNAATLAAYSAATHLGFGPVYRPHDMYVGNLVTALGCIDVGITCVIDNSHNARTSEHSDEAIRALFESGIRAVHASGAPQAGAWDHQWPNDLTRLKARYFSSDDQLVTLRMFSGANRDNWQFARALGLSISSEIHGAAAAKTLDAFAGENLLGPFNTFNHCGLLPDSAWAHIREFGVTVDVTPRSDSQYALDEGFPAFQKALDQGVKPGFSIDNETSYSGDMFTEMRVAFHLQRALAANRKMMGDKNAPKPVSTRDVLECATVNGAACAGLSAKIGTLTPGKEADIVMVRTNAMNLYPSNNAIGTVVAAADSRNVDTVIIGGVARKYQGRIVGLDMDALKRLVEEPRDYLFRAKNYRPDMFADEFKMA